MTDPRPDDAAPAAPKTPECARCGKPASLCICDTVEPIAVRTRLLILQHPQEQDKTLGTARLAAHHVEGARFRVGLSWPSLAKALGEPADPKRWAVLYLGSIAPEDFPEGAEIAVFDKDGKAVADQRNALAAIDGVIVLDGTWSQAKTLWWRNPWLLKGRRVALDPARPSFYGQIRKEPRREGLSTIEATAVLLARLEGRPEIETALKDTFKRMLARFRFARSAGDPAAAPRGARPNRGRRPRSAPARPKPPAG